MSTGKKKTSSSKKKSPRQTLSFTSLGLANWRNFREVSTRLSNRVFLIGPNASGKSNYLDAFRFLNDLVAVGGGLQQAVAQRSGVSSLRCLAARQYSDISIKATIDSHDQDQAWHYEITFNQDNRRRPVLRRERVTLNDQVLLERPDSSDESDPERLTQTYLEQVHANQSFRVLAEFFQSIKYLHIVPQLIREPERSIGKSNDPFGGDFIEQIAGTSEQTRRAWLRRIEKALKIAVPQLQELELYRDKVRGTPHLRGKYEHWRPQGAWQSEEDFSDGTLRLLGLLWAILEGKGPLLLEEPELSLHSEVVRQIPQMFALMQLRTGRQVIVSTHSEDLLEDEGIRADELLVLSPNREGTSILQPSELPAVPELLQAGMPLAEAVMPYTAPDNVRQLTLFGNR